MASEISKFIDINPNLGHMERILNERGFSTNQVTDVTAMLRDSDSVSIMDYATLEILEQIYWGNAGYQNMMQNPNPDRLQKTEQELAKTLLNYGFLELSEGRLELSAAAVTGSYTAIVNRDL